MDISHDDYHEEDDIIVDKFSTDSEDSEDDEDEVTLSTLHPDLIRIIIRVAKHPIENMRLVSDFQFETG